MSSEAKRGVIRIASNYARLATTLVIGVVLTRIQFDWLGNEGVGLIMLLGAGMGMMGLASMFQDVIRQGLVRELAGAYHTGDDEHFRATYSSSYLLCTISAFLAGVFFVAVIALIPYLSIQEEYVLPARTLVVAEGIYTCVLILTAPAYNMYVVTERFVAHNTLTAMKRASYLVAAVILYYMLGVTEPVRALVLFSIIPAAINTCLLLGAVLHMVARDRRLVPSPRRARWRHAKQVMGTFGWNSCVVLAMNLNERIGGFLMNLAFGLVGNAVFGLALRLVSYIRMAALGMTFGLDAVSARMASGDDPERIKSLLRHTTRLHAFAALPAMALVILLAGPIMRVWVGAKMEDPETNLPMAVALAQIMVVGLTARAISDGWMKILYGAGHVRRYAPLILVGGVCSPVIAGALYLLLPEAYKYTFAAWGLTTVFVLFHFLLLPFLAGRILGVRMAHVLAPLFGPLLVTLAAAPPMIIAGLLVEHWTLLKLIGVIAASACIYVPASVRFVLEPHERTRFGRAILRRILSRRSDDEDQELG